jgi:phytoene synthase
MGSKLMKPKERRHVWAVYAWCRRTDDIVDSPLAIANPENLMVDLEDWEKRLDDIWQNKPRDLLDLAMADTVAAYPTMSVTPYKDMIKGMIMDVPGLGQERYHNFDELYLYCYRVAGTVGLMTLPLFGTAKGYSIEDASEPAIALGIALQLTNILRDVGEDLGRGRIYLPLDEIEAFGLTEEDFFQKNLSPKYIKFIQFQIERAREYYRLAAKGIKMLDGAGKFAVRASLDLYSGILTNLERNQYDNFNKRAYTTQLEKLSILPKSYFKILVPGKDI